MPLRTNNFSNKMKTFVKKVNKMKQEDADKAIDNFCEQHEKDIYAAIKSITITIPPGAIKVMGSSSAQTNAAPIVLNNVVS